MDKNTAISIGAIISIIGFILLIYVVTSYSGLQERVGWYRDIFPSSTRYNQEIFSYGIIGLIGVILLVSGIFVSTRYTTSSKQNKSIYCSKCGFENKYKANFCKSCGKKL